MYASADSNEFREKEFRALARDSHASRVASEFDNVACQRRLRCQRCGWSCAGSFGVCAGSLGGEEGGLVSLTGPGAASRFAVSFAGLPQALNASSTQAIVSGVSAIELRVFMSFNC